MKKNVFENNNNINKSSINNINNNNLNNNNNFLNKTNEYPSIYKNLKSHYFKDSSKSTLSISYIKNRPRTSSTKKSKKFLKKSHSTSSLNGLNINRRNNNKNNIFSSFNFSTIDKNKLYEETLKIKSLINSIQKEISLTKSSMHKIENEIVKKSKSININNTTTNNNNVNIKKLKIDNEIYNLKEEFNIINEKLLNQKILNTNIIEKIKNINIKDLIILNENKKNILKSLINKYFSLNITNNENEKKLKILNKDKIIFLNNNILINNINKDIEESKKNLEKYEKKIASIKNKISNNNILIKKENFVKNFLINLNKKNNEEKKKREFYRTQKPLLLKSIKKFKESIHNIKINNSLNEKILNDLQEKQNKINKDKKNEIINSLYIKPLNFDNFVFIDKKNNNESENEKILLYKSLINESNKRQKEIIDVINNYENYIQQKNDYDVIKEENCVDENNNNNDNNENNNDNNNNFINSYDDNNNNNYNNNFNNFNNNNNNDDIMNINEKNNNNNNNQINEEENENENEENINNNEKNFNELLELLLIHFSLNKNKDELEKFKNDILNILNNNNDNENKINNIINKITEYLLINSNEKIKNIFYSYLLNNNNIIKIFENFLNNIKIYDENEEQKFNEKLKNNLFPSIAIILDKIKNYNDIISIENLINIFISENLYEKSLFNYFIYKIKLNEKNNNINNNNNLDIFNVNKRNLINCLYNIENNNDDDNNNNNFDLNNQINNENIINNNNENYNNETSSSIQMTAEEYKKIIINFNKSLKEYLNKKNNSNIKEILKNNINIKNDINNNKINTINVYKFFEILENNLNFKLDDEIIKGCVFTQYQINEKTESINIDDLEKDLNNF